MKQVTAYEAKDGSLHATRNAARDYEAEVNFIEWYELESLIEASGDQMESNYVMGWLRQHKNRVIDFLGERDPEAIGE